VSSDPSEDDLVMHAMLEAPVGITFMASDTPSSVPYRPGASISMALNGDDERQLTNYFHKLSEGGTIGMPLGKAPWGAMFGSFTDKFGIEWLVNIAISRDAA
jgi:PhnB protein